MRDFHNPGWFAYARYAPQDLLVVLIVMSYACMAPLKAALRTYSQSMYNAYAKHGVHVAHVVIDGVVDSPDTHQFASQVGQLMHPAEIAQAYVMLHQQPPTVWSHELQISTPKTNLGMRL